MDKFQLRCLTTVDLRQLREEIKEELLDRERLKQIARIRASHPRHVPKAVTRGAAEKANGEALLAIGIVGPARAAYLRALIAQDWDHLFGVGLDMTEKYYVYAHLDPRKKFGSLPADLGGQFSGQPFYIGKGCSDRAWDFKRNQAHGQLLRATLGAGFNADDVVKIIRADLSEPQALALEAKWIYMLGTAYDSPAGPLVNLERPRPVFVGKMQKYDKLPKEKSPGPVRTPEERAEIRRQRSEKRLSSCSRELGRYANLAAQEGA